MVCKGIELDFTNEANNLERFHNNNDGREGIEIPKCYRELTCEAVLTEDFVTGNEVGNTAFIETLDEKERELLALLIADNFASQVLTDGFYHADPHSGIVFIKAPAVPRAQTVETGSSDAAGTDADTSVAEADTNASAAPEIQLPEHNIEWIDFGMMGTLSTKQRQLLIDIVTAVVMQDAYSLKRGAAGREASGRGRPRRYACSDTPVMAMMRLIDVHPMNYLRVNATLQQYDEFLNFYGITEGDNMYLAPEDRVAIW